MSRHTRSRFLTGTSVVIFLVILLPLLGCSSETKLLLNHNIGWVIATVKDSKTLKPLSGVTVSGGGKSQDTGSNGRAELKDLKVGSHDITASKAGYETQTKTVDVKWPGVGVEFHLKKKA